MQTSKTDNSYTLIVQGHLDISWQDWFLDMTFMHLPDGLTWISGVVVDQAALHGILNRIRDLNLTLLMLVRGNFKD